MSDLKLLNINQLASISRLNRATVVKKLGDLQPYEQKAKLKLYESDKALRLLLDMGSNADLTKEIREQELRLDKAKTEKIELEVNELKGRLVPIAEVSKVVEKEYTYVRATLRSIPTKRAKALAIETDPAIVQQLLEEDIHEALSHLQADQNFTTEEGTEEDEPEDE